MPPLDSRRSVHRGCRDGLSIAEGWITGLQVGASDVPHVLRPSFDPRRRWRPEQRHLEFYCDLVGVLCLWIGHLSCRGPIEAVECRRGPMQKLWNAKSDSAAVRGQPRRGVWIWIEWGSVTWRMDLDRVGICDFPTWVRLKSWLMSRFESNGFRLEL